MSVRIFAAFQHILQRASGRAEPPFHTACGQGSRLETASEALDTVDLPQAAEACFIKAAACRIFFGESVSGGTIL
jgi:hypothetical protein